MNHISSTLRLSVGLAFVTVTVVLAAQSLGLVPDTSEATLQGRAALCEMVAIDCSLFASTRSIHNMETSLRGILARNPDVLTASLRREDGRSIVRVVSPSLSDSESRSDISSITYMRVPITAGPKPWGTVEIGFRPLRHSGWRGFVGQPFFKLSLFVAITTLVVFYFYLRRVLQHLDPSKVVPDRVRSALDTLAEGLVLMDNEDRIVLANTSFAKTLGQSPTDLQGHRLSDLPWAGKKTGDTSESFPWGRTKSQGVPQTETMLGLETADNQQRQFLVNTSPIIGDDGEQRGVLASFDDVTLIESNRVELREMLKTLQESRDEIQKKNQQLTLLATRDPLTGCLNRRSFFEHFEVQWSNAQRYEKTLSFVMVDVDHFKSINDEHGHSVGDHVLQKLASLLQSTARDGDVVCRYGGEEFCILLPHLEMDNACRAAERYRRAVEAADFSGLSVTASFGVSSTGCGAGSPQELIDQADKCLYAAKRNGRNQVARWDQVPHDLEADESQISRDVKPEGPETGPPIPFHAVTALVSALAYRDTGTAEHSRRVADHCVAVANKCMSVMDAYILETAALLHDIGKIGVPDVILLKPGPLTDEEWKLMGVHDNIGVEIIKSSFACDQLTAIIENHHAWFEGNPRSPELPVGKDIPIGARILSIADAFDAMVSDRVYRKGRGHEEAFTELRRCAGVQFDPELVEPFIESVLASDENRTPTVSRVSKQTALRIGVQIESLAAAVDSKDMSELVIRAERLRVTAAKSGVAPIAKTAEELQQEASQEQCDEMRLLELTNQLLQLCRSTQMAYLSDDDGEFSGASEIPQEWERLDKAAEFLACAGG